LEKKCNQTQHRHTKKSLIRLIINNLDWWVDSGGCKKIIICSWANNLESISSTFYAPVFHTKFWRKKITNPNVTREKLSICFRTKNVRIKCWWKWFRMQWENCESKNRYESIKQIIKKESNWVIEITVITNSRWLRIHG